MRKLIFIPASELPTKNVFGRDIALTQYRHYLGTTQQHLFYDARAGLNPNAFAALAGTIADNNNLYLHLPEHYPDGDPDHWRFLDAGISTTSCKANFNTRLRFLADKIKEAQQVNLVTSAPSDLVTSFPRILLGARGTGKSTRLAQWMTYHITQKQTPILLVAPFTYNLEKIAALLPLPHPDIIVLPPDEACRIRPHAYALVVDEAAAIPPAQLLTLTAHYPRYYLATTTDGYEGSANTFQLKTLPKLEISPQAYHVLTAPKRFAQDDALAQLIQHVFLTTSALTLPDISAPITIHAIDTIQLMANPIMLAAIWQLLCTAHYRTRPDDLKRLLDLPLQLLFVAHAGESIVGVLQVLIETPLSDSLATAIIEKTARPRGRLLMQQLLIQTQDARWAQRPIMRIHRIAVLPPLQRHGIARQLIQFAQKQHPGVWGVSYSHDPILSQFWAALQFREIHRAPYQRSRHHAPTSLRIYHG